MVLNENEHTLVKTGILNALDNYQIVYFWKSYNGDIIKWNTSLRKKDVLNT